jgi:Cd2+/Zn2+-exporting ATPase
MKQVEIILDGLTCANCAAKIEKKMNEREDIALATLDFNTHRLVIEVDDAFSSDHYSSIERDIKAIEDVRVRFTSSALNENKNENVKAQPWGLKILIGSSALLISLLFNTWFTQLFVLLAYVYIGFPVLKKAYLRIRSRQWFDENFLMSIATLGAMMINEWPEAIGVMLFYTVGEYFQDKAVLKSQHHISALLDIQVHEALVLRNDELINTLPENVEVGEFIHVPVGAKIACDGIITQGSSSLNVSSLTGESLPIDVFIGDQVDAGSINLQQPLIIQVTSSYQNSSLAKLVLYMKEASLKKAKFETTMTRFASIYTPTVVFLALVLFTVLMLNGFLIQEAIYRSLVFLVISCPCALVLSVPLSYFASMGYASQQGILFKGGKALEAARKIDMILFDKTGTLTIGELSIKESFYFDIQQDLALSIAKSLESQSTHPISKAIVEYAKDASYLPVSDLKEHIGLGMSGVIHGKHVHIRKLSAEDEQNQLIASKIHEHTYLTWVILTENDTPLMLLGIQDKIKPSAYTMVQVLKNKAIKLAILSGDRLDVVNNLKENLGLDEAYGTLLPSDKVDIAQKHMLKHHVAFVGDGVNDSAVLSLSHLGISMGLKGSNLAIQSSDVVLLKDNLNSIPKILEIAKKSHQSIIQNLVLVFLVKGIVLLFGSLGLMGMWEAVFADVGVALLAVLNAMRILYIGKK